MPRFPATPTNDLKHHTNFARQRRSQATTSESLLWSVLRDRQLCDLKFRREHPIAGCIADFACIGKKLVVEIDGGYHDQTGQQDVDRENKLRKLGWSVIRFTDKEVEQDVDAVARAIAKHLGLEFSYNKTARKPTGIIAGRKPKSQ